EDSRLWMGRLAVAPADLKYVVQAVNGVGLVTVDDNRGAYYGVVSAPPAATTLELVSVPASIAFGDPVDLTAMLTSEGTPLSGKVVTITVGGVTQIGMTGGD